MQARDFFVEVLGQHVDFVLILAALREQFKLCKRLISKGI